MISPVNLAAFRHFLLAAVSCVAATEVCAAENDYVRFLPNDGNNVYPATGLLRQWPAEGPKELWRATIGGKFPIRN